MAPAQNQPDPNRPAATPTSPRNTGRRRWLKRAGAGLLGCGGALAYASCLEPRWLEVTRQTLRISGLPESLDGVRIAHLTDFHLDPHFPRALIRRAVRETVDAGVDLVALTGDYVSQDSGALAELLGLLAPLARHRAVFASPGNHDVWALRPGELAARFAAARIPLLSNAGTVVELPGRTPFYLYGIDSFWSGSPDVGRALGANRSALPAVGLVHEPDPFAEIARDGHTLLQLSGHTHGGQCRVPLVGYAPVQVRHGRRFTAGHYQMGGSHLYVSRGLGTVGLEVRFACRPEVAILTLTPA